MYRMSSGAKELTQKKLLKKLLLKNLLKTKFTQYLYTENLLMKFIGVRIIDLQKSLDLQHLCHLAKRKLKVIAIENIILKIKLQNIKEKCTNGLMMIKVLTFVKILITVLFIAII